MIVVADTSIFNYLILLNAIDLLPRLFGTVHIPHAVYCELTDKHTPRPVYNFMQASPKWLVIETVPHEIPSDLAKIHQGEREVILLAQQMDADLVLIDDRGGRRAAEQRALNVAGLLRVLEYGAIEEYIDLPQILEALLETNFNIQHRLIREMLERHIERKKNARHPQ